jgi:hypothetical protein
LLVAKLGVRLALQHRHQQPSCHFHEASKIKVTFTFLPISYVYGHRALCDWGTFEKMVGRYATVTV